MTLFTLRFPPPSENYCTLTSASATNGVARTAVAATFPEDARERSHSMTYLP